jgi:hypothetical protein
VISPLPSRNSGGGSSDSAGTTVDSHSAVFAATTTHRYTATPRAGTPWPSTCAYGMRTRPAASAAIASPSRATYTRNIRLNGVAKQNITAL